MIFWSSKHLFKVFVYDHGSWLNHAQKVKINPIWVFQFNLSIVWTSCINMYKKYDIQFELQTLLRNLLTISFLLCIHKNSLCFDNLLNHNLWSQLSQSPILMAQVSFFSIAIQIQNNLSKVPCEWWLRWYNINGGAGGGKFGGPNCALRHESILLRSLAYELSSVANKHIFYVSNNF